MANNEKIETLFRAALDATPREREQSSDLSTGFEPADNTWEIIVKYNGSLAPLQEKYPDIVLSELLNNYGILRVPEEIIDAVAEESYITYVEKPKRLFFESYEGNRASCVTTLQARYPFLTGKDVLIGIVDSGIDYAHPDFIISQSDNLGLITPGGENMDNQPSDQISRIELLWDQTISPNSSPDFASPEGYPLGTYFTNETINRALAATDTTSRFMICPSQDLSGHGTHVTGIVAGNGRVGGPAYRGVAYESPLLVVKLGAPTPTGFPNTAQLMMAVDFCVRESLKRNIPLAINLSFGNTYGSHSGASLLETYLDSVSQLGRIAIVVGSGNEGASAGHTGGLLNPTTPASVEFTISDYTPTLNIQLWKNFWDEFAVTLIPPTGPGITLPSSFGAWRFPLGETELYSYNGMPTPYSPLQEVYLDLLPRDTYLTAGVWTIRLTPQIIRSGEWDMWMPSSAIRNEATAFLLPTPETTLTIPSTSFRTISVGAYDSRQNIPASFSGRGFTRSDSIKKPELVAPGVDIISCAPGGGYESRTGTSMATPFVTGSAALLMQWGIVEGNDLFLYGEKLKAYLINGTEKFSGITLYPNPQVGWGSLCVRNSLPS